MSLLEIANFSGGLNVKDSFYELGEGDSPDCLNFTLDELGGAVERLGIRNAKTGAAFGANPLTGTYSSAISRFVLQAGASLYKSTDGVVWTSFATFTTSARAGFCDFVGKLVVVHPIDGIYTYDGTTWALATNAVKGSTCTIWNNKLYVAGADGAKAWWSNPGDPSLFTTTTDFVFFREHDEAPITAIGIGQGMDVQGRPGLNVFKDRSAYRINDHVTGRYSVLDTQAGCSSPLGLCSTQGKVAVINGRGIWLAPIDSDSGFTLVSRKLEPYFTEQQTNLSAGVSSLVAAGVHRDRMLFTLPFGSVQGTNNRTLEFHPTQGWIVPHSFGAAFFAQKPDGSKTWHASPTDNNAFYETFSGGDDAGVAIDAWFQTRWFEPEVGYLARLPFLKAIVRTIDAGATLTVRRDYEQSGGQDYPLAQTTSGRYQEPQELRDLGHARAFSFRVRHVGTGTYPSPRVPGGSAMETGALALYKLILNSRRLQR